MEENIDFGYPIGSVPKIQPMMEPPLPLGSIMIGPGNGLPSTNQRPYQAIPNPATVTITPEMQKQITDMYNKVSEPKKHSHYFKDVSKLKTIDVYRVLELFNVTDPCLQHAIKKLLVAGGRGAGKSIDKDVQEAIDTLLRYQAMKREDNE